MYNLDSLTLKYFFDENKDFIQNSIVQKIQLPTRHEIILNIRNLNNQDAKNKKLYININPKYPHICFIEEESSKKRDIEIPDKPPMFCMQLRKYLNGSKIKDFKLIEYERILEFYFDYFDEIGSLTRMCLAAEFMGKHSNVILYNAQTKTIVGAMHNISSDKSSVREVWGGVNYIYPPQKKKLDLLNTSFASFFEIAKDNDIKKISDSFYYFSQSLLDKAIKSSPDNHKETFSFLQQLQKGENKEFLCTYWEGERSVNDSIDNYFSNYIFKELLINKKTKLKNSLKNDIKKLQKTLLSAQKNDQSYEKYKLCADYIMAYLYQIQQGQEKLVVDNLTIELDKNLSANDNAQKYYKLYKKSKATFEYNQKRAQDSKEKLDYFDEIIFNIENSSNFDELNEIKDELIEIGLIQQNKNLKKKSTPPKVTKLEYKGFEIYLGKNSKQNDYLISKIAQGEDLWFHGLNFPSSHVILKVPNNKKAPTREILEFCAQLTKENSKAKNSGKTSIIMTKRKNLKKPPNTYLGYVTYKNEIEIII